MLLFFIQFSVQSFCRIKSTECINNVEVRQRVEAIVGVKLTKVMLSGSDMWKECRPKG